MKNNLIVYVSSRNNYDMLEGEVLKIPFEGFEFVNVDDGSSPEEVAKGKEICKNHGVKFLQNKSRGVQMATQTLVDWINENRPECKWIICSQHDVIPLTKNFYSILSEKIDTGTLNEFGAVGFNVLDRGKYTFDFYNKYKSGESPLGMIGLSHLGIAEPSRRWISPRHNDIAVRSPNKWNKPFCIEFPAWMKIGINVDIWNKHIIPTDEYQFHLWFPDIAMQLNYKNKPLVVLPYLYCLNQQEVKEKYGIRANSAHGAKAGNSYHFGEYSNMNAWKERWGWDYENARNTFNRVEENYKGTLLYEYYTHDISNGPLKTFDI